MTGTFDNWSKSEKLEKKGDLFIKDVTLSNADEKIYYKVRDTTPTYDGGELKSWRGAFLCDAKHSSSSAARLPNRVVRMRQDMRHSGMWIRLKTCAILPKHDACSGVAS